MKFVLDTNVVSELREVNSGKADANVVAWAAGANANHLFVSAITPMELELGVLAKAASCALGSHNKCDPSLPSARSP